VGLPQKWKRGGEGRRGRLVTFPHDNLPRLGQEAAERKEERIKELETKKEGKATAVGMQGGGCSWRELGLIEEIKGSCYVN
jgi:hypothetical protein